MAVMKDFDVVPRDSPCDPIGIVLHGPRHSMAFHYPLRHGCVDRLVSAGDYKQAEPVTRYHGVNRASNGSVHLQCSCVELHSRKAPDCREPLHSHDSFEPDRPHAATPAQHL